MMPTIEKKCSVCGEDVSAKKRTKDPRGRYFCEPCVTRLRQTQPVGATAVAPAGEAAPPAPAATPDSGEMELAPPRDHAPAESPKAACSVCRKLLPERQIRNIDGEFICHACFAKRNQPQRAAATPVKAKPGKPGKPENEAASGDGFAHSLAAGTAVSAGILAVGAGIFLLVYLFMDHEDFMSAALVSFVQIAFAAIGAVGLMASMLVAARLLGGISFGYLGPVLYKSIGFCVGLAVMDYFVDRYDIFLLRTGLRFVLMLVALLVIFKIDTFEAFLLSVVNSLFGFALKIALAGILIALVAGATGSDSGDDDLPSPNDAGMKLPAGKPPAALPGDRGGAPAGAPAP